MIVSRAKSSGIAAITLALVLFLLVAAVLGALLGLGAQAQEERSTWIPEPGAAAPNDNINALFMTGMNGAWLAVDEVGVGLIYYIKWQDGRWGRTYSSQGFRCPLRGISAISDQDVWAVGDCGLILHGTSSGWEEAPNPLPKANLYTIQMLGDGKEGWAGGYLPNPPGAGAPTPVLLHYTNGRWSQDYSITSEGALTSLHFAQDGGWAAVGSDLWHYQGGSWTKESVPPPCPDAHCLGAFNAVRAISGQEGWAVGFSWRTCGICVSELYAVRRYGGIWQQWKPYSPRGFDLDPRDAYDLKGVYFTDATYGLMVGGYIPHGASPPGRHRPVVFSVMSPFTLNERPPDIEGDLNAVAAYEPGHALAVGTNGLVLSNGYGFEHPPGPIPTYPQPIQPATATPTSLPILRVSDPQQPGIIYFPLVGHTLSGGFRDYWQAHGGLEQFGYPLTEEFIEVGPTDNKPYTTQYFERARFEWRPENRPPYDVLLGLLGNTVTASRKGEAPFRPAPAQAGPGSVYFAVTGHNMPPQFADYWRTHGGLPVYGYPISEPFNEANPTDGKPYLAQYFERNRFEYHPELAAPYRVSLGLLGAEVVKMKGWLP